MPALDESTRQRLIRRVLWVTLALNALVASAKLWYGYTTATLGLVADGYHSLLDGTSNVVGLVGVTLGAALPDAEHPYGHRKFEILSAMAISMFIFYGAWTVLHEAYARVSDAAAGTLVVPQIDRWSFAIAAGTMVVNVFVAWYERRRGVELASPFLLADSAHTASDVLVTTGVIVGLAATRLLHPLADVAVAVLLGFLLVRVGYRVLMTNAQVVADRVVFQPEEIERVAREVAGVLGCTRIRTRGLPEHAFLDMVILVAPEATVADAHAVADRLEENLAQAFPGLRDIVIHIEPGRKVEA